MAHPELIVERPRQDREGHEQGAHDAARIMTALPSGIGRDADQVSADAGLDEAAWCELVAEVAGALGESSPDQFLILEYHPAGIVEPYAQAAHEMGGYRCELVSEEYLPADQWPIDHVTIRRQGWTAPDQDTPNWWTWAETAEQAARILVDGLRHGRGCEDLSAYSWRDGTFPGGGGGGGEPLPAPHEQAA